MNTSCLQRSVELILIVVTFREMAVADGPEILSLSPIFDTRCHISCVLSPALKLDEIYEERSNRHDDTVVSVHRHEVGSVAALAVPDASGINLHQSAIGANFTSTIRDS